MPDWSFAFDFALFGFIISFAYSFHVLTEINLFYLLWNGYTILDEKVLK